MSPELRAALELLAMLLADPRSGMLIGLLIAAAWFDVSSGRIPNVLVYGGSLAALAYAGLVPPFHMSVPDALLSSLAGLGCGLVLLLPFYLLRAMGAGDVKLMAMAGAFLGYPEALGAVLGTFVAGGALSLAYLGLHGGLGQTLANLRSLGAATAAGCAPTLDRHASAGSLPYGVAIAVGTIGFIALLQLGVIRWQ
ncbi:MAG TPA: prepilin peptidase [Rhodocyclaceae bacterium]